MDANTIWIILGVAVPIVVPISIFAGTQISKKREREKTELIRKLTIHFEDIKREVMNHISEMARSLTIRHERLVTSYASIGGNYPFTKSELYNCFELHFPEEAKEWEELNTKAIGLNEGVTKFFEDHQYTRSTGKQYFANQIIQDLQQEFGDYAKRLARKIENIEKYDMGKEFKKEKNCPICSKF